MKIKLNYTRIACCWDCGIERKVQVILWDYAIAVGGEEQHACPICGKFYDAYKPAILRPVV